MKKRRTVVTVPKDVRDPNMKRTFKNPYLHLIEHTCDLCLEKSDMQFNITENAAFFACQKHAKALSGIIYPVGDQLMAHKASRIFS